MLMCLEFGHVQVGEKVLVNIRIGHVRCDQPRDGLVQIWLWAEGQKALW
jgi:hypothetical protein